jgi:predicted metal-dependent hydrolase
MLPPYTLHTSTRARHLRITIHPDGTVTVTKPTRATLAQVEAFLISKQDWINHHLTKIASRPQPETPPGPKLTRRDYLKHKAAALTLATSRLAHYNQHYNFTYKNIVIRNQKTRWGSCSKKGNLNFNYKIILIPEHLADYIIVHELCHLGQFNHSDKFWRLVAETIPDYKACVRELHKLHL